MAGNLLPAYRLLGVGGHAVSVVAEPAAPSALAKNRTEERRSRSFEAGRNPGIVPKNGKDVAHAKVGLVPSPHPGTCRLCDERTRAEHRFDPSAEAHHLAR